MIQFEHLIASQSIVLQHVVVVLEETAPVGHRKQGDLQFLGLQVQVGLHVHAHRRSALIENGKQGLVVEQPSHGNSLFFAPRQHIVPVVVGIKAVLAFLKIVQLDPVEQLPDVVVIRSDPVVGMRVNDLISESTRRQVWPLGDVEQFVHVRSFDDPPSYGPESTQCSEEGALAAPIGTTDHGAHASVDLQRQFLDQYITIGGNDGHLIKDDVVLGLDDLALVDAG